MDCLIISVRLSQGMEVALITSEWRHTLSLTRTRNVYWSHKKKRNHFTVIYLVMFRLINLYCLSFQLLFHYYCIVYLVCAPWTHKHVGLFLEMKNPAKLSFIYFQVKREFKRTTPKMYVWLLAHVKLCLWRKTTYFWSLWLTSNQFHSKNTDKHLKIW